MVDALPPELRDRAFRHASWPEGGADSYERLEFLGDAVLGCAIADELYRRLPDVAEGMLAKRRAAIVSRRSCAIVARELGFDDRLEAAGRARGRDGTAALAAIESVLAAVTEAVLGALYLHYGYEQARGAVVTAFAGRLAAAGEEDLDHKTELQEELQRQGRSVEYVVVDTVGPPHQPIFTAAALVDRAEVGRGVGTSKKAAEQEAARAALEGLRPCT